MRACCLTLLAFALAWPVDALAFKSYPPGSAHDDISRAAAECAGLDDDAAGALAKAVRAPDWDESKKTLSHPPNERYRASHHFDRPMGMTSTQSARAGRAYVQERREAAASLATRGDVAGARSALGQAMHAAQDFFAHSNFSDLSPADKQACLDFLKGKRDAPPPNYHATAYDPQAAHPDSPENDPEHYAHRDHAKDSAGANDDARAINAAESQKSVPKAADLLAEKQRVFSAYLAAKDPGERAALKARMDEITRQLSTLPEGGSAGQPNTGAPRTNYEVARDQAIDVSCQMLNELKARLSPQEWARLWGN